MVLTLLIFFSTGVLSLYTGFLYNRLYQKGKVQSIGKPSLKKLKVALLASGDEKTKNEIITCLRAYKLSLVLFYTAISFAGIQLLNNIKV